MPDPIISAVAAAVAGKAAEAAVQAGQEACAALIRLVRDRLGRDKKAAAALEAAGHHPRDEATLAELGWALERLAAADDDFAGRLRELWPRAAAELTVSQGDVANSATGSVGGHLMQARDVRVEGGLRFGDIQTPDERLNPPSDQRCDGLVSPLATIPSTPAAQGCSTVSPGRLERLRRRNSWRRRNGCTGRSA